MIPYNGPWWLSLLAILAMVGFIIYDIKMNPAPKDRPKIKYTHCPKCDSYVQEDTIKHE